MPYEHPRCRAKIWNFKTLKSTEIEGARMASSIIENRTRSLESGSQSDFFGGFFARRRTRRERKNAKSASRFFSAVIFYDFRSRFGAPKVAPRYVFGAPDSDENPRPLKFCDFWSRPGGPKISPSYVFGALLGPQTPTENSNHEAVVVGRQEWLPR